MKYIKFCALFPLLLIFVACDYDQGFRFHNNSTRDVFIHLGTTDRSSGGSLYPDTAVTEVRIGVPFKQGEERHYTYSRSKEDAWGNAIFCLFVFDADVFKTDSWDEIKKDYKILKRYDLTLEDLRRLKWRITYPSTDEMKSIKQFPPYDE